LPRHPRLRIVIGSVLDRSAVRDALTGCDTVFHLAGLVGMQLASRYPAATYEISVLGTENVLAHTHGPAILLSSSCVYGPRGGTPCRETDPVSRELALDYDGGVPGYATGKWEMEQLARRANHRGARVLIVRPFNVVGPGQSPRHGMVVPRFIQAARRDVPLVIHDDGRQSRSFSAVDEFARALVVLAALPSWSAYDHLVNLGTPASTSVLELAHLVIEATCSSSPIVHTAYDLEYPGRRDVRARAPDMTRAGRAIGALTWASTRSIVGRIVAAGAGRASVRA
jgi:UDP-glucose 4-epimerase